MNKLFFLCPENSSCNKILRKSNEFPCFVVHSMNWRLLECTIQIIKPTIFKFKTSFASIEISPPYDLNGAVLNSRNSPGSLTWLSSMQIINHSIQNISVASLSEIVVETILCVTSCWKQRQFVSRSVLLKNKNETK